MLIILLCGLSVWPAYYAIGAEVSSLHLRSKSQGLGWGVNGATTTLFAIILPYMYNIDAEISKERLDSFTSDLAPHVSLRLGIW